MIEALEIGISLALGDGVSEGIAAARSDLRAMEAAMGVGAVSVQRLRDAAAGALGVVKAANLLSAGKNDRAAKSDAALATQDRPAQGGGLAAEPAPAQAPPSVQVAETKSREIVEPGNAGYSAAVASDAPSSPIARASTIASSPDGGVAVSSAGTERHMAGIGNSVASEDMGSFRLPPARPAPAVTILRMEAEAPAGRPSRSVADAGGADGRLISLAAGSSTKPRWATGQPDAAAPAMNTRAGVASAGAADRSEPGASHAAAPPVIVQQQGFVPREEGGGPGLAPRTASTPAGQAGEQARMEGDVFLDGQLVGRWISKYLAREAGRASAGPTGFDARRAPLMPGATVGM